MGYYTRHNLKIHQVDDEKIKNDDALMCQLEDEINKAIEDHYEMCYSVGSITEDWEQDDCKWYDHVNDMIKFSREFPNVVFELEGIGEENGDMWKEYYKNGLYQDCPARVIYDEYNPKKLKIK